VSSGGYIHSQDRLRYWRGTNETKHPPGIGVILQSPEPE
jgi:hypothetical protein